MQNNGWVKLYRKLQNKGYYKNSKFVHLWVHLLLKANHKKREFMFNNQIIIVKDGQLLTGRKQLSKETEISESSIERILRTFETEQQIEQQKTTKFRLITVLNWKEYQKLDSEMDNKRTTSGQQADTNKNDKNDKNDKNTGLAKNQPTRNNLKFSKNDYNEIIKLYEQLTGIKHKNNEYLLLQQTIKTMFLNGRTKQEIIACMQFINNKSEECWQLWNLQTINKQLPRFLSGKF